MPRNDQGTYSLPPGTTVAPGDTLLTSQHNPPLLDIAQALSNSLSRDGQGGMRDDLDAGGFNLTNVGDVKGPGGESLVARAYCVATQAAPVAGSNTQVEIAFANLVLTQESMVKFTATLTCEPTAGGGGWNTHFEVNLDGVLRGLRGFVANPLRENFTNVAFDTLPAGTHRISLLWYGVSSAISVGTPTVAILIAETL